MPNGLCEYTHVHNRFCVLYGTL